MATAADDRFFRNMVTNMRNGVLAIDREGRVVMINEEACRILEIAPDGEDSGRHFSDLIRHHHDVVRVLAGAFDMSTLPNRAELRLKPSGKVIGYTLSLVRDERLRVHGAALFFKDLTLVEQAEERERLRDRLAALGEMAATIAHEVKNPLASIEVMAGLVRRQVADRDDLRSLLADIISEAKMANAIVVEVLEFVRPIRLQMDRTSLLKVVEDAIPLAERKIARGGARIETAVPDDLPAIQGDHHQLCQVVSNLLINALEALGGRGAVRISAQVRPAEMDGQTPEIELVIADDGPGIPGEITDRVFNPFFTTKPQGSGLGLAIVRKIVDAHDGRIDVATGAGQGTAFVVTLPVGVPGQLGF
ncbi:MAG: ATP-binding protein [Vicinamibacterales bacterium]